MNPHDLATAPIIGRRKDGTPIHAMMGGDFNSSTRQNFLPAPVISFGAVGLGQTGYSILPKVGLLRRIILLFSGVITVTEDVGGDAASLNPEAPFSLYSRIRLTANGNTALFDAGGYGAMIAGLFSAYGFSGFGSRPVIFDDATVPGPTATAFSALAYAAPTANGANQWNFGLEIPLGLSDDWRAPIGLILAAAPDTVLQVEVTFAASLISTAVSRQIPLIAAGTTTAVVTSAVVTPFVEFFTIPSDPANYPSLANIHTWTQLGAQPIQAVGDNDVVIPRGNTIMRLVHGVWTNTAPDTTDVVARQLRFNSNEIPYSTTTQLDAYLQRERMVRDLPDGWFAWDLWNSGTPRDAINTLNLNDLTSRVTIGAAATIAGVSDIRTLMEQLVQLSGATGS